MGKLVKHAPDWHAKAAAEINREFAETNQLSETARQRRARLGLMLIWVKMQGKADGSIPHGTFGDWMKENLSDIPKSTAGDYITEAKSICDLCKWQISEIRNFETPPHQLLNADSSELKGVEKERFRKLSDVIEQQKHFRAVTQYKQVELKDDATVAKIGRRKGEGGASREQRAAHQQKLHEMGLKERKAFIVNLGEAADRAANEKGIGDPECAAEFEEAFPKIENLFRFMQSVRTARS
jgi:hypothetical protein